MPTSDSSTPGLIARLVEVAIRSGLTEEAARALIDDAPLGWLELTSPTTATAEISLLAKPLRPDELRVRIEDGDPGDGPRWSSPWHLTLVTVDRPGLLAITTAVMARHALSISSATALCWPGHGLALQRLVVTQAERELTGEPDWTVVGQDLRHGVASGEMPNFSTAPVSDVSVHVDHAADGRATVVVHAEDGLGLLATVSGWLTAQGLTIDDAKAETKLGRVRDVFCVRSTDKKPAGVDAAALVALLSAR